MDVDCLTFLAVHIAMAPVDDFADGLQVRSEQGIQLKKELNTLHGILNNLIKNKSGEEFLRVLLVFIKQKPQLIDSYFMYGCARTDWEHMLECSEEQVANGAMAEGVHITACKHMRVGHEFSQRFFTKPKV